MTRKTATPPDPKKPAPKKRASVIEYINAWAAHEGVRFSAREYEWL